MKKYLLLIYISLTLMLTYAGLSFAGITIDDVIENSKMILGRKNALEKIQRYNLTDSAQTTEPINAVILGLDNDKTRTDIIIVVNFNSELKSANLLSIPRDTMLKVNGKNTKINDIYYMGHEQMLLSAIKQITGIDVSYYAVFDLIGFRKLIDALDGVKMEIPFNMDYDDPLQDLHIHLKKGIYTLDGNQSEQFIRYRVSNGNRRGYKDGDIGRIQAQQVFINQLIKQKMHVKYITKIPTIYATVKQHVDTNIGLEDIYRLTPSIMGTSPENIQFFNVPGEGHYIDGVSYFIIDVTRMQDIINTHFHR